MGFNLFSHKESPHSKRKNATDSAGNPKTIALAGNPNVGKSTLFNLLTGMHQHTGNWSGKTVSLAEGSFIHGGQKYTVIDLPGTYSLMPHSAEEEVARDCICFDKNDKVVVVCDATCLERNLGLVLQVTEITDDVILCVNLADEAERKGIELDIAALSSVLKIPVTEISARSNRGVDTLLDMLSKPQTEPAFKVSYTDEIERLIARVTEVIKEPIGDKIKNLRFAAVKLLCNDRAYIQRLNSLLGFDITNDSELKNILNEINSTEISGKIASCIVITAEGIALESVHCKKQDYLKRDRKIDKIMTGKFTGVPIMLALLMVIFWITLVGANYPSELLTGCFNFLEDRFYSLLCDAGLNITICDLLAHGIFRVVAWVIAVMLPPMAGFKKNHIV